MSNDVQALVWRSAFPSPVAKLVALKLADNANDDGENVWPSIGTVERLTGLSRSAVCEWVTTFDNVGLVVRTGRSSPGGTMVRKFDMARLASLADTRRRDGSGRAPQIEWRRGGAAWQLVPTGSPPAVLVHQADQSTMRTEVVRVADSGSPRGGPKLSSNHQTTITHTSRARGVDLLIEQLLQEKPEREPVVRGLLKPLLKNLMFDAPDPISALGYVADQEELGALDQDTMARVVKQVTKRRSRNFNQYDLMQVVNDELMTNRSAKKNEQTEPAAVAEPKAVWRPVEGEPELVTMHLLAGTPEYETRIEYWREHNPKLAKKYEALGYVPIKAPRMRSADAVEAAP